MGIASEGSSALGGMTARRVLVLGATGSIGRQTLDVIGTLNERAASRGEPAAFEVVGLACGSGAAEALGLARAHGARWCAVADGAALDRIDLASAGDVEFLTGEDAAERLVRSVECDLVVASIVGIAGLSSTIAALELGRDVALANKETLVAAGSIAMGLARDRGSRLLPVDSEHAGVWQALVGAMSSGLGGGAYAPPAGAPGSVERVTLTASGGPFRGMGATELEGVTPARALEHPTWRMGKKNTIDSATLMNKSLEILEAHHLFGLGADRLGVLVHPRSIVHAVVEMVDGQMLAHLGAPDMRGAIQHALTFPARVDAACDRLDLRTLGSLVFEEVDLASFPAAGFGDRAIRMGGGSGAALNAANEVCVGAFLEGRLGFCDIPRIVEAAMERAPSASPSRVEDVLEIDADARGFARERMGR